MFACNCSAWNWDRQLESIIIIIALALAFAARSLYYSVCVCVCVYSSALYSRLIHSLELKLKLRNASSPVGHPLTRTPRHNHNRLRRQINNNQRCRRAQKTSGQGRDAAAGRQVGQAGRPAGAARVRPHGSISAAIWRGRGRAPEARRARWRRPAASGRARDR